jgi:hypothetical protein
MCRVFFGGIHRGVSAEKGVEVSIDRRVRAKLKLRRSKGRWEGRSIWTSREIVESGRVDH